MNRSAHHLALAALVLALSACAHQVTGTVQADAPGFLLGLWHGFIFPVAAIGSFSVPGWAVYAVPNNGLWYNLGYFIGVVFLGVGANRSRTVYVDRRRG